LTNSPTGSAESKKNESLNKNSKDREVQQSAIAYIQERIAPVLNEVCGQLEARGHEASVQLNLDQYSYPSAHLTFRVVNDEPHSYVSKSKLSFVLTQTKTGIEVQREIVSRSGSGSSRGHSGAQQSKSFSDLTSDWAKEQALSFVAEVLKQV
jgi:hypothetical protein